MITGTVLEAFRLVKKRREKLHWQDPRLIIIILLTLLLLLLLSLILLLLLLLSLFHFFLTFFLFPYSLSELILNNRE